jgi:hypothetical protein
MIDGKHRQVFCISAALSLAGTLPACGGVDAQDEEASEEVEPLRRGPCTARGDCTNVLALDGFLHREDGATAQFGSDIIQKNCQSSDVFGQQKVLQHEHWQLSGPGIVQGKPYQVDLHVYGVLECKTYVGGTGPARTDPVTRELDVAHDLWLVGGRDNGDHWNTHALTVTPAPLATLNGIGPQDVPLPPLSSTYELNQCPSSQSENHFTWRLDYTASITVPGGSYVNYVEYDTNCRMIANCGKEDSVGACEGPYNVVPSVRKAVPKTNARFRQPIINDQGARGQWWFIDVTDVHAL